MEHLAHLVEGGRVGRDGLVRVAQQQEVRAAEVAREHGQLGGGVVLHLVHHHVLRVGVAQPRERHLQVEPLERREAVGSEEAHADTVDAQPVVVLHGGEGVGVAVGQVAQGERALLLLVGGRDELAEDAQLLVGLEGLQLVERLVGAGHLLEPALQARVQLLAHERDAVRACGDAAELVGELADLVGGDETLLVHADVLEVVRVELERFDGPVDAGERGERHVHAAAAPVGRKQAARELVPGEAFRVALAQVGEHACDVMAEHRVRRDEEDLARIEAAALLVEEVGDALQEHRRLAAARDAAHQQHRHVLVAHDGVLLLLDGGRDGLHLRGALLRERRQQERVLNGDRGVEIGSQAVFLDVELAAQLEVGFDGAAVGHVRGAAVVLVVVGLGHGRAPVHHEAAVVLVQDAGGADVELLGLLPGLELQGDFGEVGLLEQKLHLGELGRVGVLRQVVPVDHAVHGREVRVGLHRVGVGGEVGRELLRHRLLVGRRLALRALHLAHEGAPDLLELRVGVREVALLLVEDGVGAVVGCGGGFGRHGFSLQHASVKSKSSPKHSTGFPHASGRCQRFVEEGWPPVRSKCRRSGRSRAG